jgi:pheromone shutdown protein TraB
MLTGLSAVREALAGDDPRLDPEFCRLLPGEGADHDVVLVGVVHDHPSGCYRVETVAERFRPDTLALEVPQLAVPGFERASATSNNGGEMTSAIAAVPSATVVGIDRLGPRFARRFVGNAREMDASLSTVRRALGSVRRIARHAVARRLGREDADASPTVERDVAPTASAEKQAANERTEVSRSRSLLGAIERPRADLLLDASREDTMADNVARLRRDGTVLAVVGINHLDELTDALGHEPDTGE